MTIRDVFEAKCRIQKITNKLFICFTQATYVTKAKQQIVHKLLEKNAKYTTKDKKVAHNRFFTEFLHSTSDTATDVCRHP